MNKIEYINKWDKHDDFHFIYTYNFDYVASSAIEVQDEWVNIHSIYVNEKYRGKGIGNIIINDAIKKAKTFKKDIYLLVRKNNFIINTYKKLGFKYFKTKIINGIKYNWMKYEPSPKDNKKIN